MLSARHKFTGELVTAYFESKRNGPFICPECKEEVILKEGPLKVNHFAHVNPLKCNLGSGESEVHRECKWQVYNALSVSPNVNDVRLEWPMGPVRPDVSATIRGIPVAIEMQISSLSIDTIKRRTIEYNKLGMCLLWLLQWTPEMDASRYAPEQWQKWVHALYFGHVYVWLHGLKVASYHLEPSFRTIPRRSWVDANGKTVSAGGYAIRSKRFRRAARENDFDLVSDFEPKQRFWWQGQGLTLPDAKLFVPRPG